MDLKALMQKLETINTTQTLAESTEERVVITESASETVIEESTFKSSIARSLAEEFGYDLKEADPNDPNGTAALAGQQKDMMAARAKKDGSTDYTSGLNPAKSGVGLKAPAGAAATMGQGGQAASPAAAETPAAAPSAPAAAPAKEPGVLNKVGNFFKQNAADYDARQKADAAARSPEGMEAAKAKLTPSQLKWLGGAKPEPEILGRMPAPLPGEVPGGQAASPAASKLPPGMTQADVDKAKNAEEPDAVAQTPVASTADPKQVARLKELLAKAKAAGGSAALNPNAPGASAATTIPTGGLENQANQAKTAESTTYFLNKLRILESAQLNEALTADEYKELQKIAASLQVDNPQDKELQALTKQALDLPAQFAADTPAAAPDKPADGQAASPAADPAKPAAAKKPAYKADPIGQSIANQLKMTTPDAIKLFQKNNGLNPDGQIGPKTTDALKAAAQKMGLTVTSGVGTSTAGAGRGGQGGPTATQMAQAPAAGGQAASPAADPKVADIDAQLAKYKKYPQSNAQIIARLEKEKVALGGTSATPDQQAFAKSLGGAMEENIIKQDDAILAMIRTIQV